MDALNGPGAVDLTAPRGLVLRDARLISASAVDVMDGGLHDPKCRKHLRVIDIITGTAWFVPLSDQQLDQLSENTP